MSVIKYFLPYGLVRFIQKKWKHNKKMNNEISLILKKNVELKNKFLGERCFIVGNGSSLKHMDLLPLKNEYLYVVNEFIQHENFYYLKPNFYSEIEPYNALINLTKDNPYYIDNYYSRLDKAFYSLNDTILFFRYDYWKYINQKNIFRQNKIYYLKAGGSLSDNDLTDDISKPNSFMDGVIYSAICNCVYMGFKKIYFIGCDCDWFRQKTELHFYRNHECITTFKTNEEALLANYKTLRNWRIVSTHFKQRGIQIYNAGIGGDNDVCERVDYYKLFNKVV